MAESRREKVDRILSIVPPLGSSLASDLNAEKFSKVTNWTHEGLLKKWAEEEAQYQKDLLKEKEGGPKAVKHTTTTCNAFTGWYGIQLGCKKYVGMFPLDAKFPEAWVPATGDNRPGYGDICRFTRFHVGVSLHFEGDTWYSVEGGQGGPSSGRDIVTRKKTAYTSSLLKGWLDISKLAGVELAPEPPAWLLGWWLVTWRGSDFFYLFERDGRVKFTRTRPRSTSDALPHPVDSGLYSVGVNVTITWKATGSLEILQRSASEQRMRGMWNGSVPLAAIKL